MISEKQTIKNINNYLKKVKYKFKHPPLVVGGYALQYYGIRKAGHDLDVMVSSTDWKELKKIYPKNINLFGGKTEKDVDATINLKEINVDLIKTLVMNNYKDMSKNSIKLENFKIISLKNLIYLKSFPIVLIDNNSKNRHAKDIERIIKFIIKKNYSKK